LEIPDSREKDVVKLLQTLDLFSSLIFEHLHKDLL
jgi:hypothetical protein